MISTGKILFFSSIFCAFSGLISCSKEISEVPLGEDVIKTEVKTHKWYYFTNSGFEKIDLPQRAPASLEKPWTECIRMAGAVTASDKNDMQQPEAYALINRSGFLTFSKNDPVFHGDINLFNENTAIGLFLEDNKPIFSVYKSLFFNDKTPVQNLTQRNKKNPFLVTFDDETGIFFPIIFYEDLKLAINEQITDFSWNGKNFYCSVKTTENEKNAFSYFTIEPSISILSITPKNVSSVISMNEATAETFRNSKAIEDFSKAPQRLQDLLSSLPDSFCMNLEVSFTGNSSTKNYEKIPNPRGEIFSAKCIIGDTFALALFADGTCYFSGACYSRPVLVGGKVLAFRLPKLPGGYVYSYPALSGTKFYAGWEESSFYKTGRAGFIEVDLDSVLYTSYREENSLN